MPIQWMWLDWLFLIVIALSTIIAWFRGFVREVLSLITWVVAALLSLNFATYIGTVIFSMITNPTVRFGVSFLAIFFVVLIAGMIVNFIISRMVKGVGLGFFDSILGAIFGCLRGCCITIIIIMILAMPWIGAGALLDRSVIATVAHPIVSWAMQYVPSEDSISKHMDEMLSNHPNIGMKVVKSKHFHL